MAEAAAKKKTLLEEFMAGCKKGFYVGVENIMPAMVLAYALILFLNITGLMNIIADAVAPVMALFGLPGAAIVALISAFFCQGCRCCNGGIALRRRHYQCGAGDYFVPGDDYHGHAGRALCALRINIRS